MNPTITNSFMELIFGTHNNNKLIEIHKLLPSGYMLKSLTDLNYDSEIEETGSTLEENALIKARTIFNTFKKIVLQTIVAWRSLHWEENPECFQQDMPEIIEMLETIPKKF